MTFSKEIHRDLTESLNEAGLMIDKIPDESDSRLSIALRILSNHEDIKYEGLGMMMYIALDQVTETLRNEYRDKINKLVKERGEIKKELGIT